MPKPIQVKDEARPYECTECYKSFSRSTHLKRHQLTHSDERPFGCKHCEKRFRRADHLKKHETQHLKIKPHKCDQCEKTFGRLEHLRYHTAQRHTNNPATAFECIECKFVCETAKELRRHQKSHYKHEIICKVCNEQFTTKSELNEHSKMHYDQRPFLCTECGMRFVRNDYLVIHMRRHTGEKRM